LTQEHPSSRSRHRPTTTPRVPLAHTPPVGLLEFAVVGFVSIDPNASVGAGMGYFGLAGMVTFVCYFILRSK